MLGLDYPCGGAGMILSREAVHLLVPALLTAKCPFQGFNDVTIGYCAQKFRIPLVHVTPPRNAPSDL